MSGFHTNQVHGSGSAPGHQQHLQQYHRVKRRAPVFCPALVPAHHLPGVFAPIQKLIQLAEEMVFGNYLVIYLASIKCAPACLDEAFLCPICTPVLLIIPSVH